MSHYIDRWLMNWYQLGQNETTAAAITTQDTVEAHAMQV